MCGQPFYMDGCETWTINNHHEFDKKHNHLKYGQINRKMIEISWKEKKTNEVVKSG